MAPRHVIVDGSNLATEGRSMPSLAQLDQAVREFIAENPTDVVTVVVDASFGHRIDPSEVSAFEEAEEAGEVISPPAGAIGRGDAFLLRIAEKTGATVLSNDSFQEFHVEHTWLFDKGRLVGGKPVPGVGWIFMDRSPVRGAKSREVTKEAKRKKRETEATPTRGAASAGKPAGSAALAGSAASAVGRAAAAEGKVKTRSKSVDRAIARATEEVVGQRDGSKSRRRRGSSPPAEPVNEPLAFITFIAAHPLGSDVIGTVLEYSSHGAFVEADGARCYIPLSAMADPAPRRAREVVTKGEPCTFVVQAFDPQRRGIELALPGFARVAGEPTAETVEAEISGDKERLPDEPKSRGRSRSGSGRRVRPEGETEGGAAAAAGATAAAGPTAAAGVEAGQDETAPPAAAKTRRRAPAKKVAPVAAAETAAGETAAGEEGGAGAASGVAKKAPAKKAAAAKKAVGTTAKSAPTTKKAAAAKKAAAPAAESAPTAKKAAAATKKAAAAKKAGAPAAESAPAAKKAAAAKKAPAKKAAAPAAESAPAARKAAGAKKAPVRSAPAEAGVAKKVAAPPPEKAATRKTAAKKGSPPLRLDPQ